MTVWWSSLDFRARLHNLVTFVYCTNLRSSELRDRSRSHVSTILINFFLLFIRLRWWTATQLGPLCVYTAKSQSRGILDWFRKPNVQYCSIFSASLHDHWNLTISTTYAYTQSAVTRRFQYNWQIRCNVCVSRNKGKNYFMARPPDDFLDCLAASSQKYVRGLVLRWTCKIDSDVSPYRLLNFKKCEICSRVSTFNLSPL